MNRKHKVSYDQQSIADIKEGNRILVNKIMHVKPIINTQNTKPKAQPHVHLNAKGQLMKECKYLWLRWFSFRWQNGCRGGIDYSEEEQADGPEDREDHGRQLKPR